MRVLLLAAFVAICAANRPADACRGCKEPTEADLVKAAVRVFAGKVVKVEHNKITLEVDTIWKGTVAKRELFRTTCWFALKPGANLIILDRAGKSSAWIDECLQVKRDGASTRSRIDKLAGSPHKPT